MKLVKKNLLSIVIVFLLIVFVLANFSLVFAPTIATHAFITVEPNPVGINQPVLVCWCIQPSPTTAGIESGSWDIEIEITKPDGSVVKVSGSTSAEGLGSMQYMPNMVGYWSFEAVFSGWSGAGDDYLPSVSNRETLIVQGDPVDYDPEDLECEFRFCGEPCCTCSYVLIVIIIILIVIIIILGVILVRRMRKV